MFTLVQPAETHSFSFATKTLRVVMRDGDPWFVAADIADALDYREAKDATRGLDEDEKGRHILPTHGGDQEMTIVNESGLYSLILGSRKPEAKKFKKWVTSEVLPSIRKTGSYSRPELAAAPVQAPLSLLDATFTVHQFRGFPVRSMVQAGETWVVTRDALHAIGVSNPGPRVARLPETDRRMAYANSRLTLVNRSGLARLTAGMFKFDGAQLMSWADRTIFGNGNQPLLSAPAEVTEQPHVGDFYRKRLIAEAGIAKRLIAEIEDMGVDDETGYRDVMKAAAAIVSAIAKAPNLHALALGLADWICISLDGATTGTEAWEPLQYF